MENFDAVHNTLAPPSSIVYPRSSKERNVHLWTSEKSIGGRAPQLSKHFLHTRVLKPGAEIMKRTMPNMKLRWILPVGVIALAGVVVVLVTVLSRPGGLLW